MEIERDMSEESIYRLWKQPYLYITHSVHKSKRVRLMCALRAHINKSIFGKILLEIEKAVKTFSISDKLIYNSQCP